MDAAQNQLHSISRHRTSVLLTIPLSFYFFLLLCFSSSHHHLCSLLSIPPPPLLPAPPQTGGESGSGSSGISRRTGRCAEAWSPSCGTGKALCSPLISVKDYLFEKCVCVCVCVCGGRDMKVGREDYHTLGAFTAAEATWGVCYHGYVSCSHYHRHVLPSACIQEEQDVHSQSRMYSASLCPSTPQSCCLPQP